MTSFDFARHFAYVSGMDTREKDWWRSKTIRVNAVTLAISLLGVIAASPLIAAHPTVTLVITGIAVPMLNVFLRFETDQPIK